MRVGELPSGPGDSIVDVAGISVGQVTLDEGNIQTGVTVILPHQGNIFRDKVPSACHVINGFGKSVGLVQVAELGNLESPIFLSNTFSVAACLEGGLDMLLAENDDIARSTGSANVVVMECNDGYLSDMRARAISREHVREALVQARESAGLPFERGSVGAGRGMSCYGLKGGIGSASRVSTYTVGALLLTNFGRLSDLLVDGRRVGKEILSMGSADDAHRAARVATQAASDGSGVGVPGSGSVIVVLATDAPLDSRQLHRLCVRASSGLARTGATIGGGSGEIVLAFSTAYTIPHYPEAEAGADADTPVMMRPVLHEDMLDGLFRATTEVVEAAVLDSLFKASTVRGRDGHERRSMLDFGLFQ
ncbi:MAG: P1 family peptidase [Spirochaetia bacterium]|nr:P1 family peptidase [Spirochaetia bacterium]